MRHIHGWMVAALGAALLAACGGGGSDTTARSSASSVQVMGDSLQDVGTFGFRATVQGADSTMYPEYVGLAYGRGKGCNFFSFNGTTFIPNTTAGCKNYAVAGGVINAASSSLTAADPRVIGVQIATSTAAGSFSGGELLVVDGGGNDAAALVSAYLKAATDGGVAFGTLVATMGVTPTADANATAVAYMKALADNFYASIKSGLLDKGAQRIVLLNIPAITNTPRFQMVLDSIAAASGGGTAGATARAQSEAVFRGWVASFNNELATKAAGDGRVLVIDLAKAFDDQIAHPAQFGVTNNTVPACPATGVGSDGLPTYSFPTCTDTALSALQPSNPNWWRTYYFSDGFHPTPYGHKLAYQLIAKSLATAGWL